MYLNQDRKLQIIPEEEFPSAIVQIEEELSGLDKEEKKAFLESL